MPLKDYRFTEKEYSKMLLDVHAQPDNVDLYSKFKSRLSVYPIFEAFYIENEKESGAQKQANYRKANLGKFRNEEISNNKILRYIGYFYDPDSPVNQQINDYKERKTVAAELAGFKLEETGEFESHWQEVLRGNNQSVNLMVIYFLRLFNNTTYTTLRITLDQFYNEILPEGDIDRIQKTTKFVDLLTKTFMGEEKEKEEKFLKPVLFAIIDKELAEIDQLRPERILEKMLNWG